VLDELGRFFRGEKCVMIVEAHTDAETWKLTDYESDVALTRTMAANVAHALVTRCGVPAARIAIQPMGSTRPVDREGTPSSRRRNRRIEFVVGADP
jgi:flagellar motor protein MotB